MALSGPSLPQPTSFLHPDFTDHISFSSPDQEISILYIDSSSLPSKHLPFTIPAIFPCILPLFNGELSSAQRALSVPQSLTQKLLSLLRIVTRSYITDVILLRTSFSPFLSASRTHLLSFLFNPSPISSIHIFFSTSSYPPPLHIAYILSRFRTISTPRQFSRLSLHPSTVSTRFKTLRHVSTDCHQAS